MESRGESEKRIQRRRKEWSGDVRLNRMIQRRRYDGME